MSEVRVKRERQSRSGGARLQLVLAAERYFALQGFAAASLKDIQEAAGQRNASAVHYHFGSRDQLINAILDHRIPTYAEKRRARTEALEQAEGTLTIRAVVAAWITPLAEEIRPRDDGNYYIRFLNQLRRNGPVEARARAADLQMIGYGTIFELLEELTPELPERLRRSRLALTAEIIISGLSQLEAALPAQGARPEDYPALAVSNLIDYATAGIACTPDPETLALADQSPADTDFHFNFRNAQ